MPVSKNPQSVLFEMVVPPRKVSAGAAISQTTVKIQPSGQRKKVDATVARPLKLVSDSPRVASEPNPFRPYGAYVARLENLLSEIGCGSDQSDQVAAALDGQAALELRQIVAAEARQKYGTFFTGTALSSRLVTKLTRSTKRRYFYDPTCGMGDLLLAAANTLPLASSLSKTLVRWGEQLAGTDLHPEFIRGAKIRLMLLARLRHQSPATLAGSVDDFFPHLRVSNGLDEETEFTRANTLLMNPPYGLVKSAAGCTWAGGRVSEAAVFMITALERAQSSTEILAILPDVLRSGSFSKRWRTRLGELAKVHLVEPYGVFDDTADVDVFLLRAVRRAKGPGNNTDLWPVPHVRKDTTISHFFDIHVGRVVPHRDPEEGPKYAYIHPRCVPGWQVVRAFNESRRFLGRVYMPPFVAIKRTSRPGHPYRAVATVVAGNEPVAVENHFIVCEPKDKTLRTCRQLMRHLQTDTVNQHLNERICCRHLTVGVVEGIPFDLR